MASNRLLNVLVVGVKDLPRNSSWLVSRALRPVRATKEEAQATMNATGHGIVDTVRRATVSVKDAVPGSGDSVELRIQRARAAAERAHEAEDRAVQMAEDANALARFAKEIAERDTSHLRELRSERAKAVELRVTEARSTADAQVEEARSAAQSEADHAIAREESDAQKRLQKARDDAEAAQKNAEAELSRATALLTEARTLADEATEAAQAAADEAHQQAERLVSSAAAMPCGPTRPPPRPRTFDRAHQNAPPSEQEEVDGSVPQEEEEARGRS